MTSSTVQFSDLAPLLGAGIKSGIERQWLYGKELVVVKPEYLFTVSVADQLASSLDLNTRVALEATTKEVVFFIRMSALSWRDYFAQKSMWDGRNGKVDILLTRNCSRMSFRPTELSIIEVKGIDPPRVEVKKDIERLIAFLRLTPAGSPLSASFLAYPTTVPAKAAIETMARELAPPSVSVTVTEEVVHTGEHPDDGIPVYRANVLRLLPGYALQHGA